MLQKFIRKYEPHGAVVTKEEVVIVSEDTDVCKQTSPKNLSIAVTLMKEHRVEAGSRDCPESHSTNLGEPPEGRPRSQPPAPRDQREPKDLGLPPDGKWNCMGKSERITEYNVLLLLVWVTSIILWRCVWGAKTCTDSVCINHVYTDFCSHYCRASKALC